MTVETPARFKMARRRKPAGLLAHPRVKPVLHRLGGITIALVVLACAALVAVWPTLTLVALGLVLVAALAWYAPPFGLVGAVLLYGLEGVIKVGLGRELARVGVNPDAVGAAFIDLALIIAGLGLVRHDRGRTLRTIWDHAGRWAHIGLALLAAWLVLSLAQMALTDDFANALAGFRLTQAYLLAVLAGMMLLATRRPERVLTALVAVLLVLAAYAAVRGVAGPTDGERVAALGRATTPLVPIEAGVIFRNTGSFSSAIGLVSFLAPAGVFLLILGLSLMRLRLAAWIGVALVLVALVGSHVRAGLIAITLGAVCAGALLIFMSGLARRTKVALGLASVPLLVILLVLGALATTTASGGSEQVAQRSAWVLNPLSDPSLELRFERWREALSSVKADPLGTGVGTVGGATVDENATATFADNSYIKILKEQGPLGAVAFVLGILATFAAVAAGISRRAGPRRAVGIAALSACVSFFVLLSSSEAIEQPGKVLAWLFLGIALWAAFGAAPGGKLSPEARETASTRGDLRELVGRLPGWARSRYALILVLPLLLVPVGVSLLRASHFDTTLEVLPTRPPGNAGVTSARGSAVPDLVANPGFQLDTEGWKARSPFELRRATDESHSGTASLVSVRDGRGSAGERAASTPVALPGPGRYRVQAWVRLPAAYGGGSPRIALEGLSGSARVATREGDPRVLERWQPIWSDYVVGSDDLKGRIVLGTDSPLPAREQRLHWDDVSVMSWNAGGTPAGAQVNLVSNPGFEYDMSGWGDPPSFVVQRSTALVRSGSGSLRSSSDQRAPNDTNAGYTHLVFPRAGTYRARVWAYIPRSARAVQPAVFLEGFSGGTPLAERRGDPKIRDAWQLVSVDFKVSSRDLEGSLVLRSLPVPGSTGPEGDGDPVVYWDDVAVPAMRSRAPIDSTAVAAGVRSALEEPQLRFDVSFMAPDDTPYDPTRATVTPTSRPGTSSYLAKVESDVPSDARSLAEPLRSALISAASRNARRRAQADWLRLISRLAEDLSPSRAALLQQRANVLQRVIGAQAAEAVVVPPPASPANAATRRLEKKVSGERQRVIGRLGSGLPPRQRALLQQRVDDLQRMLGAQTPEFFVLPYGPAAEPTRPVDRLIDQLPGPFPPRVAGGWAAVAGALCAVVLFGMLLTGTAVRRRTAVRRD